MTSKHFETMTQFETYIKNVSNEDLGSALKEYIGESNHSGWDGYSNRHKFAICAFLEDLMVFHQELVKTESNSSCTCLPDHQITREDRPYCINCNSFQDEQDSTHKNS
jgi:hypothetical protein